MRRRRRPWCEGPSPPGPWETATGMDRCLHFRRCLPPTCSTLFLSRFSYLASSRSLFFLQNHINYGDQQHYSPSSWSSCSRYSASTSKPAAVFFSQRNSALLYRWASHGIDDGNDDHYDVETDPIVILQINDGVLSAVPFPTACLQLMVTYIDNMLWDQNKLCRFVFGAFVELVSRTHTATSAVEPSW